MIRDLMILGTMLRDNLCEPGPTVPPSCYDEQWCAVLLARVGRHLLRGPTP